MSGQSVTDRLTAAKHSIAGHGLAKSICKATTEEVMGPKKKHIDYLVACTNEPNVSIPQMANLLIERTQQVHWVVVYKSLITTHNVMNYGNERFTQYLASNNCSFNLGSFRDKTGVQGYDMSTFIRRYSKYLNEKAISYREMAFDFCKVKRGKDDGLLRTMPTDKLLKTLPILQHQVDVLLEFDCTANELTNGVINACFMLLFKDLIRLFACYNDGIINLLEKFFEMNKKQCKEALEIYRRFLTRMDRVSEFLKVAETVGIDKGDIPDLAKAPSSLLDALEEHLKALESAKKTGQKGAPASVTSAINSMAGAANPSNLSEDERKRILAEENNAMEQLKTGLQAAKATSPTSPPTSTNPFLAGITSEAATGASSGIDLLGAGSPVTSPQGESGGGANDLLGLSSATNPFAGMVTAGGQQPGWGATQTAPAMTNSSSGGFATENNFAAAFGTPVNNNSTGISMANFTMKPPPGFDGFGEVMQPAGNAAGTGPAPPRQPVQKLIQGDLDSSLASLAGNLNINGSSSQIKKMGHQWTSTPQTQQLTGGAGWQQQQPMAPMAGYNQQRPPPYAMAPGMMPMQPGMMQQQQPGMMGGAPMGMMGAQPGQPAAMYAGQPMQQQAAPPRQNNPNDPFGAL